MRSRVFTLLLQYSTVLPIQKTTSTVLPPQKTTSTGFINGQVQQEPEINYYCTIYCAYPVLLVRSTVEYSTVQYRQLNEQYTVLYLQHFRSGFVSRWIFYFFWLSFPQKEKVMDELQYCRWANYVDNINNVLLCCGQFVYSGCITGLSTV